MKLVSTQKGNRISEIYIYTEDNKTDIEMKEKYNYCSEEVVTADTIINDGYESYLAMGIYENTEFRKNNGILYNINNEIEEIDGELKYVITYNVFAIRVKGNEININKQYKYTCNRRKGIRSTLDRFIKDLFKDGTISKFYEEY